MRFVIVDCGSVGLELARRWTQAGHQVIGTTTDPARLDQVKAGCTDAVLLSYEDGEHVRQVVGTADGAVLTTRPQLLYTRSLRERVLTYRRSIINLVRAAASAQRRLVLFSSIAVYGDGGAGDPPITEQTPVTTSLDPAAQAFAAVERMVLESPTATVLRLPEAVVGDPREPDLSTVLRGVHEETGGTVPYDGSALMYTIDYRDAAAATAFVVEQGLAGIYHVVPDEVVPPRAEAYLNGLAGRAGLPPLRFTGALSAPRRPISSAKLRQAGFRFAHPDPGLVVAG